MLNSTQLQIISNAIEADPSLNSQPNNSDGNFTIAIALNQLSSPDFYVWKTSVSINEIMGNGFDWTRVDNLTVGKSRIWEYMTQLGVINPHQANVRAGINACFSTAGDLANRNAIYSHCQRLATKAEKLLATGNGTTSTDQGVGPATMGFEGMLNFDDIEQARNL
jgi:hypothetical protein